MIKKDRILFLDTGYKYEMEDIYGRKLRLLSESFCGSVLTFGRVGEFQFGEFTVYSLPLLKSKMATFIRSLLRGRRMVREARRVGRKFDLIVTYDPLNTGLLGTLLSRLCGIPLMVELNGDFTDWHNYSRIRNPLLRAAKRWLYLRVESAVLHRAAAIKLLYPEQLTYFKQRIRATTVVKVFPNYLDLEAFRNLGEARKVAIIGFPFVVKGIDIAVAAFAKIASRHPDWVLEILGWYAGEEKELLDRSIADHRAIRHHPPIPKAQMPDYVGRCGVVVCASRTEGFPRVIKEAMHAAKPCIVSDVGGLPHAIQDGSNGLLFRSGDIDGLAAALDRLLGNESLRMQLGSAALEFAEREYTASAYLKSFHDFVSAVLSR